MVLLKLWRIGDAQKCFEFVKESKEVQAEKDRNQVYFDLEKPTSYAESVKSDSKVFENTVLVPDGSYTKIKEKVLQS